MQSELGPPTTRPTELGGSRPPNQGSCERLGGMRFGWLASCTIRRECGSGLRWRCANGRVRPTYEIAKEAFTMKKVITGTFAAALFAVSVSAQTPAPAASQPMQDRRRRQQAGDGHRLSEGRRHARLVHAVGSEVEGRQGCRGHGRQRAPAAPPISASSLKLVGSKLSDHVGHTVEVTGTIAAKADKPAAADPAARPAASVSPR